MKTEENTAPHVASWQLVAPDWAALDTIRRAPLPVVLWPVCEKPLLSFWLDEAVRLGVPSVTIEALDRPHLVREWLDQRDLWSRSIAVISQPAKNAPGTRVTMDHLPGEKAVESPTDGLSLLRWWFQLQEQALCRRTAGMVHLDREVAPGVWTGPGAQIDPSAKLVAPCWVGSYARIGPKARLGPSAFVGPGAFLDEDVEVEDSMVCAESYVGPHTSLRHKIVQGGLLLDLQRGLAVEIADPLVLASLQTPASAPPWWERALAAFCGPALRLAARLWNRGRAPINEDFIIGHQRPITLATYPRGPLILRRSPWLQAVAGGQLRLSGILPRTAAQWDALPTEVRASLAQAPVGVIALSDLHHCHSAADPDEWMHALYQSSLSHPVGAKELRKAWLRLAFSRHF